MVYLMNVIEFTRIENRQKALQDLYDNHPDLVTRSRNLHSKFYLSFEASQIGVMFDGLLINYSGILRPDLEENTDFMIDKYAISKFNGRKRKELKQLNNL